jgi:2-succinyl-5-enolpyruvyl-6-hydroxy-3-cyclohexene-1-carboxylate synthase
MANAASMFELNYHQPMDKESFQEIYTRALKVSTSTIIEIITGRGDNLAVHKHLQDEIRRRIS